MPKTAVASASSSRASAAKPKAGAKKASKSRSARAGLVMPVGRVHSHMKKARDGARVSGQAPIYMTAILEYLTLRIIGGAVKETTDASRQRISGRLLQLALRSDDDVKELTQGLTMLSSDVLPGVGSVIQHKRKAPASTASA